MRPSDNPFNITRRESAIRFRPPAELAQLVARLRDLHWRGAIIGPHGHGKSTLLAELAKTLSSQEDLDICQLFLNAEQPRLGKSQWQMLRKVSTKTVICLDGAEQLGVQYWLRVKWLSRQARGLIITTHTASRLPTLMACHSSPELLADLINDLLAGTTIRLPHDLHEVHSRHHGNLRDALDELYDYCQTL